MASPVSSVSPLYKLDSKNQEAVIDYYKATTELTVHRWNLRDHLEQMDHAYYRDYDCTEDTYKSKVAKRLGDTTKFQNVTIPVVMPQVESALVYQQSVFLSGFPIFGVVADPAHADAATQMDAIISEQQAKGNWVAELLKALRRAIKYNYGPVEVVWKEERMSEVSKYVRTGQAAPTGLKSEVVWQGNAINAVDPYNIIVDTRVPPHEVHTRGEFVGKVELMNRVELKQFAQLLPGAFNVKAALESSVADYFEYYIPNINPASLFGSGIGHDNEFDWFRWAGVKDSLDSGTKIKNVFQVATLYARIVPSDFRIFKVPGSNTPQVWKFIVVNGKVPIYARPIGTTHNYLPIIIGQALDDGLGYQSKSFTENQEPFQDIITALSNSNIAARRRAIGDRLFYDPVRISKGDINNSDPIARIPVKPTAFDSTVGGAVHSIPFRDDQTAYTVPLMQQFMGMADNTSGMNPARQGQFVKGNKTRKEFSDIMGNATGRDQSIALSLEGNFFFPIKEIIKANILEFQPDGKVFNRTSNQFTQVSRKEIKDAMLEFKISDGLTPSEKLIDGDSLSTALQTLAQNQQLGAEYNIGPLFSYLMKSAGADLVPFEKSREQVAYEQAVGAWQQTAIQIVERLNKRSPPPTAEEIQKSLPPQPLPEQFGYSPFAPLTGVRDEGTSVLSKYTQVEAQQAQQAQPEAGGTNAS